MRLHVRQGAIATSWDDIAAESGVSRATVYHHFNSLETLVPACAQVAFDLIEVPTPEQAREAFAALPSAEARLHHFIVETCRCYAAGADWLGAAWRERDLVLTMGEAVSRLQRSLHVMLGAVVHGEQLSTDERRSLTALLDFPFWEALDHAGVPRRRIPARIEQLARAIVPFGAHQPEEVH